MKTLLAYFGAFHVVLDLSLLLFLAYCSREARLDREKADECLRSRFHD